MVSLNGSNKKPGGGVHFADRSPDNAHERWTGIDFATGIPIQAMGLGVPNYRTTMSPSLLEVLPKPVSDAASYSVFCTGHL